MNIAGNRHNILGYTKQHGTSSASCVYKWLARVTTLDGITQRICHYIDEETKPPSQSHHRVELKQDELPVANKDYIARERHTFVRGFFIDEIQKRTGLSPHLMEPESMLREVNTIWREGIKRYSRRKSDAVMHNAIISLKPEYCKLLSDSGKSVDEYLLDTASKTMRKLEGYVYKHMCTVAKKAKQIPPNREDVKLAYIVGVHHDRKHIHAHISIFPYTKKGEYIKIATDKKRNYDAYGETRDFARKVALDKYKKELYAPALMVENGQDLVWQRNLLMAHSFANVNELMQGNLTEKQINETLFNSAEDLKNLTPDQFSQRVGEAYTWAEERFKGYKANKITLAELEDGKASMRDIENEAKSLAVTLPKDKMEIQQLEDTQNYLQKQLSGIESEPEYPSYFPKRNPEDSEDLSDALYRSAMENEEEQESAKSLFEEILQVLTSSHRKMTMVQIFQAIIKDIMKASKPDERAKMQAAKLPKPEDPEEKRMEGRKLLKEKLTNKNNELEEKRIQKQQQMYESMDRLRFLSHQHTAAMLDVYLKECIINNKKPVLFSPEIKDIVKTGSPENSTEDIRTAIKIIKENDKSLRETPEMVYSKSKSKIDKLPNTPEEEREAQEKLSRLKEELQATILP